MTCYSYIHAKTMLDTPGGQYNPGHLTRTISPENINNNIRLVSIPAGYNWGISPSNSTDYIVYKHTTQLK